NLFFTRDVGIVIGEHSIIGSMRYGVRWTEELLVKALFRYHEKLENAGILYDGSEEKRNNYTLEGGDVHPIRPDLLVRGFGARAGVLRRQPAHPAGAGAVGVGVQLLHGAARRGVDVRAQRRDADGAAAHRVSDRLGGESPHGGGVAGGRRAWRDHDRGERAGARRRRPAL